MNGPAGPLVAVCTGHRCAALRRLQGEDDALGTSLREAVRGSRGGVLVASPCVGACARAPVVAVGQRGEGQQHPRTVAWLGDLDAARREEIAAWVARLGQDVGVSGEDVSGALAVPTALLPAVLAVRGAPPAPRPSPPAEPQPRHPPATPTSRRRRLPRPPS